MSDESQQNEAERAALGALQTRRQDQAAETIGAGIALALQRAAERDATAEHNDRETDS